MNTVVSPTPCYLSLAIRLCCSESHCSSCGAGAFDVEFQIHGVLASGETQHDGMTICPTCYTRDSHAAIMAAIDTHERNMLDADADGEGDTTWTRMHCGELRGLVRNNKIDMPMPIPLRFF